MQSKTLLSAAMFLSCISITFDASAAEHSDRWRSAMEKFAAEDKQTPPPENAILFIGSSSIRKWDLPKSFGETAVLNRGFGGSKYEDIAQHSDQLIKPYQPGAVVLYSGDNDLWHGKSPTEVHEDFLAVRTIIRAHAGNVPIVVIGIKPSIARAKIDDKIIRANGLLAAAAKEDAYLKFIDPFEFMLDNQGQARPELFVKDGLHLNQQGYALWTPRVKAALEQLNE